MARDTVTTTMITGASDPGASQAPVELKHASNVEGESAPDDDPARIDDETDPESDASDQDEDEDEEDVAVLADPTTCLVCQTDLTCYAPLGCRHESLCRRCAMKQATGGKCRVRRRLFSVLRQQKLTFGGFGSSCFVQVCGERFYELKRVR